MVREFAPRAVVTCARGSSDHAATFARYLIETRAGVLTSHSAPSVSSLYATKPDFESVLFIAISQSGASPDLLAAASAAREAGAGLVVNADGSPLSRCAHHTIPLHAGEETSVAATKSYIASLAAVVHFVAAWTRDRDLEEALAQAPDLLARAWLLDWSAAIPVFRAADSLYVIGRGLGLGIAREAALKFKETCGMHAEAFSAAELRHGPSHWCGRVFRSSFLRSMTRRRRESTPWSANSAAPARRSQWRDPNCRTCSRCRRSPRTRQSNRC